MATIKSYTDIEQSRKLAEILPLESADMYYLRVFGDTYDDNGEIIPISEDNSVPRVVNNYKNSLYKKVDMFPCWSLASLLGVLPKIDNYRLEIRRIESSYCCCYTEENNGGDLYWYYADNPIDACYEMIIRLHELKML